MVLAVEEAHGAIGFLIIAGGILCVAQGVIAWRAQHDPWFARHQWLRRIQVLPTSIVGPILGSIAIIGGILTLLR